MKPAIFFVVAVLLLPFIFSLECSVTSDQDYCESVFNSNMTETEKDCLFSSILYADNELPNHEFIAEYNYDITVESPPYNTTIVSSTQIKDAWMSFLTIFPSVYHDNTLYVPSEIAALSEYDYRIQVPRNYYSPRYPKRDQGDCKRLYRLVQDRPTLKYHLENSYRGTGRSTSLKINSDGNLSAKLKIETKIEVKHYRWHTYCCQRRFGSCIRYCHVCRFSHKNYERDSVEISEDKNITLYTSNPSTHLKITNKYFGTTKGKFQADNYSTFKLKFNNSYLILQNYYYDILFDKKPYYFAYLQAHNFSSIEQRNINVNNGTFFVKDANNCSLSAYNHFYNTNKSCDLTLHQEEVPALEKEKRDFDLSLFMKILVFLFVSYVIYRLLKTQSKKVIIPLLIIILLIPPVLAEEPEDECGITNLASCIPQKMYEFILVVINAPLLPMLLAIVNLLTAEPAIDIFYHLWNVIRYILGFFYIFLFLYAGYTFLSAGGNPIKRSQAKDTIKDTVIMIVLIQGSFYIYELMLTLASTMDASILSMIDPHFFMLTADNLLNIGLEFMFTMTYSLVLFITMLMLILRYIVVCFGVVLFPIGLFCYFVPPLRSYGRFILQLLGTFIFITFIDLLIVLACSLLIEVPLFENIKILVMINCFSIVNYTLWLATKFALKGAATSSIKDDIGQAVKYIALLA